MQSHVAVYQGVEASTAEPAQLVLRARFTNLEKTIASLQSTGSSLLSQLSQLNARSRG